MKKKCFLVALYAKTIRMLIRMNIKETGNKTKLFRMHVKLSDSKRTIDNGLFSHARTHTPSTEFKHTEILNQTIPIFFLLAFRFSIKSNHNKYKINGIVLVLVRKTI